MISREEAIRRFIIDYPIEVPEEMLDAEVELIYADMRHRMTYATMAGRSHGNPIEQEMELKEMSEDIAEIALFNVKEELVMKELMARDEFEVTAEELKERANEMARKENTTIDFIKKFFGENFEMLESDLRRRKAEDWIYEQAKNTHF